MDAEKNAEVRRRLVERRSELAREGDLEIAPLSDDPAKKVDEDAAPLNEMSQVIASSRNVERARQMHEIGSALSRLEEDPTGFGLCEACEVEIPMRRLELMPWARLCIACQSEHEADDLPGGARKHLTDYR